MKLRVALISILALASLAAADVLWDQSNYDQWGMGYYNADAGSPPFGLTWHTVNDVTVEGSGWVIDSITNFYQFLDPSWGPSITEGYLHVWPRVGSLPVEDPSLDILVPMVAYEEPPIWRLVAEGLDVHLAPGEYWIGITPISGGGSWGPEIQYSCLDYIGIDTASYDAHGMPPGWFIFNPGLDAAILIEGSWSVPTEMSTWSSIKSLY